MLKTQGKGGLLIPDGGQAPASVLRYGVKLGAQMMCTPEECPRAPGLQDGSGAGGSGNLVLLSFPGHWWPLPEKSKTNPEVLN